MVKEFKTIDEQIEILKARGLMFDDEEFAKEKLLETNYYNTINGYKKLFVTIDINGNEIFKSNVKYEELFYLSEFDRSMRTVYLENILKIENRLKTLVAYYFSEEYGYDNYLKIDNFDTLKSVSNKDEVVEKKNKKYSIFNLFYSKRNSRFY